MDPTTANNSLLALPITHTSVLSDNSYLSAKGTNKIPSNARAKVPVQGSLLNITASTQASFNNDPPSYQMNSVVPSLDLTNSYQFSEMPSYERPYIHNPTKFPSSLGNSRIQENFTSRIEPSSHSRGASLPFIPTRSNFLKPLPVQSVPAYMPVPLVRSMPNTKRSEHLETLETKLEQQNMLLERMITRIQQKEAEEILHERNRIKQSLQEMEMKKALLDLQMKQKQLQQKKEEESSESSDEEDKTNAADLLYAVVLSELLKSNNEKKKKKKASRSPKKKPTVIQVDPHPQYLPPIQQPQYQPMQYAYPIPYRNSYPGTQGHPQFSTPNYRMSYPDEYGLAPPTNYQPSGILKSSKKKVTISDDQ